MKQSPLGGCFYLHMNAKQSILEKIKDGSFALLTGEEICRKLRLGRRESLAVRNMLYSLCRAGELLCDSDGRFGTAEQFHAQKGVFSGSERGFGFFIPDDGGDDLFIPHRSVCGALHGDTVLAIPVGGRTGDEGEILAVIDRGYKEIVGTYRREGRAGVLYPDERKYAAEVYIPFGKSGGAGEGVKAVAKITSFEGSQPIGEISEVLGARGDLFAEELSLIRSHALREEFPAEVVSYAENVAAKPIPEEEISRRLDLRSELIVTIDGEDTRDIDDAISVSFQDGKYFLGVHIADVAHYVRRGDPLDKEAFLRGTSVYFPDRVLPMLPKALSNGICSLNEGADRLTLSCLMTVDGAGNVTHKKIVPSIIKSRHRLTYTEVTKIAEGDGETVKKYPDLVEMTAAAVALTKILQKARKKRGSVELDVKEAKILFEDGKISIPDYERTISHEMIEQFMVLTNESVAAIMTEQKAPFIYRVHESPSEEKIHELSTFLAEMGVKARFDLFAVTPRDYQTVLESLEGTPVYSLVNRVMLRSMMKAKYSPENVGHFGLASDCYCHFTSPIRRYPDLAVHRIIKDFLRGNDSLALKEKYGEFARDASSRSSACERNAEIAERDVDALYTVAYMQDKIGEEYDATVSGVTSFGLFAELDNTVEGLIPIETLPGDYFEFIEERRLLKGANQSYRLGERIRVRVTAVDWGTRRTQFQLLYKIR